MKSLKLIFAAAIILMATTTNAQKINIDTEASTIKWEGKKVGGAHDGFIQLKDASFIIKNNQIVSGEFVMDMTSITNSDIEDEKYNAKLVGHLKSEDFFGVDKYPSAILKVSNSSTFKDGKAEVSGNLTIKDKTNPIEFIVHKEGNRYTTTLVVDRSKYDVRYGSTSFFDNLGDKVIYDEFTLDVNLTSK